MYSKSPNHIAALIALAEFVASDLGLNGVCDRLFLEVVNDPGDDRVLLAPVPVRGGGL